MRRLAMLALLLLPPLCLADPDSATDSRSPASTAVASAPAVSNQAVSNQADCPSDSLCPDSPLAPFHAGAMFQPRSCTAKMPRYASCLSGVFNNIHQGLHSAWYRQRKDDPHSGGSIIVKLRIAADGSVQSADAQPSPGSYFSRDFLDSLTREITRTNFGPAASAGQVSYALNFMPWD